MTNKKQETLINSNYPAFLEEGYSFLEEINIDESGKCLKDRVNFLEKSGLEVKVGMLAFDENGDINYHKRTIFTKEK